MNSAPINLIDNAQTDNDELWTRLGASLNEGFWPVTIKAFYFYGTLLSIARSAEVLVKSSQIQLGERRFVGDFPRYFTAFAVFASAIELFGRTLGGIVGERGQVGRCLNIGFSWLGAPGQLQENNNLPVLTTNQAAYTVGDLINLRNFSAHGQAVARMDPFLDPNLMQNLPRMLGNAIETWWTLITTTNLQLCTNLANANFLPIHQTQPINLTAFNFSSEAAGTPFFKLDYSS